MPPLVPYSGTVFWLVTFIFIIIYSFIQKIYPKIWLKNTFMVAGSAIIIFNVLSKPYILFICLFILTLIVFTAGKVLTSAENIKKKYLLISTITIVVIFLCYFKYDLFQNNINNLLIKCLNLQSLYEIKNKHLFFVGVSYFSFKFIHFLIECQKKKIENLNYITFLNYTLFFPSFFSGPINRYNSFSQSLLKNSNPQDNFLPGILRIITGLFKKIVLADTLFPFSISAINLHTATQTEIIIGLYAYAFFIYFNFAGYTDMAIGCGRMVGVYLPENFNYPFFKRNLQAFWANWHMSLTSWLTDYIYWPLAKKNRKIQFFKKHPISNSNLSIIVTFIICGLWHGDGLNFFFWGLYHGLGLAILNLYSYFIKKHATNKLKIFVHKSPIAYGLSMFLTFHFFCTGLILFACNIEQIKIIFHIFNC